MNTIYLEMIFNDLLEKIDDIRIKSYKLKNHWYFMQNCYNVWHKWMILLVTLVLIKIISK